MSGGFRRSSAFGIVGVIVVMMAVALIALQFGSGTAHPTGALIAIVGIVFGFIAILMVLQRRDLNKVSGAAEGEALAEVGPVSDPTTVPPGSLIAAMAVRPVDERGRRRWHHGGAPPRLVGLRLALRPVAGRAPGGRGAGIIVAGG